MEAYADRVRVLREALQEISGLGAIPGILGSAEDFPTATTSPMNDNDTNSRILTRLQDSEFFRTYRDAFEAATGMPLVLELAEGENWHPGREGSNQNRFCQLLNGGGSPCEGCALACQSLARDAETQMRSIRCFAGLQETAVPIRAAHGTVAFLKTGQVFNSAPGKRELARLRELLKSEGRDCAEIAELEQAYSESEVVPSERYSGMTTLLAAFSLQLSALATTIAREEEHEPKPVARAKAYIQEHLEDKITLDQVADHVHVSSFYFCKIFKAHTGMTFTEYVGRQRVEWAKELLLYPDVQVTEIAYDVGFQSLSQFNRSFLKFAGASPTEFRKRELAGQGKLVAA